MNNNQHGGNIYKKAKELGIEEKDILDFSANINPLGLPEHLRQALASSIEGVVNYPDPESTELTKAISLAHKVRTDQVVCGNGGADLLYRMAYGLKPGKALVPAPTFIEYEEALREAGTDITYYYMDEGFEIKEDILDLITEEIDLIVLCNPNNPTGILTGKDLIRALVDRAEHVKAKVMVDECFLDLCREEEEYTMIPSLLQYPHLIILKSFTKLFALPGVRLGYMLCGDPAVAECLKRAGQAWPVNYFAQKAGEAALADPDYKYTVQKIVEEELSYMKRELKKLPVRLYDGKANYLFFRTPGINDLDRKLENRGIMIRNCSNYVNLGDDYWRAAVKTHEENRMLIRAIKEILLWPKQS